MSDDNKLHWFPVLCDETYFARLREDYPDKADWDDESLYEYFNERGSRYQNPILWDHIGDAMSDYEPLADSYLEILSSLKALVEKIDPVCLVERDHPQAELADQYIGAIAAIAKTEGK